jgi:hypothetical protein
VTITAPEQIELKVGGNTVTIASAGTIAVTAATTATLTGGSTSSVTLSAASADVGGNQVNVAAKAVCTVSGPMVKIG